MIMAMTAIPLAILGCGLPGADVTPMIQWHVVGMFAPSFFTGILITRYGAPRIMQAGSILLLGHVVPALSGVELMHFLSARWLYDRFGWVTLNLAVLPLLLAAPIAVIGIERKFRRLAAAAA